MLLREPKTRLTLVFVSFFATLFLTVKVALLWPELNFVAQEGHTLESQSHSIILEQLDFTSEPGMIVDEAELEKFYSRQTILNKILSEDETLTRPRKLSDLPSLFWIQILVGFGAFIISGWILSLSKKDLGAKLFALSGFSTLLFTFSAAIYSTRPLAIAPDTFILLTQINAFGASLFGITTLLLFLVYPEKIRHFKWVCTFVFFLFGPATIASLLGAAPSWLNVNLITFLEMIGILIALGIQFFLTRGKPQSRAILTWLGFSFAIGAGAFIFLNAFPIVLGSDIQIEQGHGFLFFLLIYIGVAAGFRHFRLFEIGDWAFKLFFNVLSAFAFLVLDALLIFGMGLERLPALSLSLILIALFYIPIRNMIFTKLWSQKEPGLDELLSMVINVIFTSTPKEREERWESLLKSQFKPLKTEIQNHPTSQVKLDSSGLILSIPTLSKQQTIILSYPFEGQRLYSPKMLEIAQKLCELVDQAEDKRVAYERGVLTERNRITKDLHDDVGSKILTSLHQADDKSRPALQEALAEIRAVVHNLAQDKNNLHELLADLRFESKKRLEILDIELGWETNLPSEKEYKLSPATLKSIQSSTREIISNAIKHSGATKIHVSVSLTAPSLITILINDNGHGFSPEETELVSTGIGLKNIKKRFEEIHGKFQVLSSQQGSTFILEVGLA